MEISDRQVNELILTFSCADKPGIVATVAQFFCDNGFNIRESSQYEDCETKRFFMRTDFEVATSGRTVSLAALKESFTEVAEKYAMSWGLHDKHYRPKILIAVSKWGHCLNNILNRWKLGSLPIDIVGVVSNHQNMRSLVDWYGLPYFYLPVTADAKTQQEAEIFSLFESLEADCLILARYMQILSDELCGKLAGRAINIHHSFLPGFKGAKPYHQAHARGVKLIGATAHYVTADLDEGPIIEQAVERVSHAVTPEQLVELGQDIEAVVLQRAIKWHAEHRVIVNGQRTVVFNR